MTASRLSADRQAVLRGAALPLALLVAWTAAAHLNLVNSHLLVPVEQVLLVPFTDHHGRNLWPGLAASLSRMVAGFVIGAGLGLAVGVLMGVSRTVERMVAPSLNAVRQIALYAWIPLLTAWFGSGDVAKVAFISLAAFFPMVLNTHDGLRAVPAPLLEVARVLTLSPVQKVRRVLLPGALPSIFIGVQLALIYAWIATVGAEYAMGLGLGVGTVLSEGREHFRMDIVIAGVLTLALVGYGINTLFGRLFRRILVWQPAGR